MKAIIVANHKKMLLSGLLILGHICTAYSKPMAENEDADYAMQSDDDYQYDDENVSPHSKMPVDVLRSTVPPYLALSEYTRYTKPGEDAILECPVKNLSANNVVMWINQTVLSQSNQATNSRVSVDGNYTLTIHKVNEWDTRTYTCQILPQKLVVHAKLVVGDEPQEERSAATTSNPAAGSSGDMKSISALTFLFSIVSVLLLNTDSVQRI